MNGLYKELIERGFERIDIFADDSVFYEQEGYKCFWLVYTLLNEQGHELIIHWAPDTGIFDLRHSTESTGDVHTYKRLSEVEVEMLIDIYSRKKCGTPEELKDHAARQAHELAKQRDNEPKTYGSLVA
jgi:hypothetical protein